MQNPCCIPAAMFIGNVLSGHSNIYLQIEDVRVTMFNYLKRQAEFYQKMANSLNDMAKLYEF